MSIASKIKERIMAKKYPFDKTMRLYVKAGIREGKDPSDMLEYLMLWFDKGKVSEGCFEELAAQIEEYEAALEAAEEPADVPERDFEEVEEPEKNDE